MWCSYLKRIFRDLFERSGFEDDGIFDWDLALKAKADGTSGLEGLKYGTPREGEAADGGAVAAAGDSAAVASSGQKASVGISSSRSSRSSSSSDVFS